MFPVHGAAWKPGIANVHGMSISDDGKRGYFVSLGSAVIADLMDPTKMGTNGLLIYDLSDIQARKPNPQVALIGKVLWKDGAKLRKANYSVTHEAVTDVPCGLADEISETLRDAMRKARAK